MEHPFTAPPFVQWQECLFKCDVVSVQLEVIAHGPDNWIQGTLTARQEDADKFVVLERYPRLDFALRPTLLEHVGRRMDLIMWHYLNTF